MLRALVVLKAMLKRWMNSVTVESSTNSLQWLGACGFDGKRRVVRSSPTGALQLLLKVACAVRKRQESLQDAGHRRITGNKRRSLPVL